MAKTPFELRNEVLAQRVVKNLQRRAFERKKHWQRL